MVEEHVQGYVTPGPEAGQWEHTYDMYPKGRVLLKAFKKPSIHQICVEHR